MREQYDQTDYVEDYTRFLRIVTDKRYKLKNLRFVRNEVVELIYNEESQWSKPNARTNIYIGIR